MQAAIAIQVDDKRIVTSPEFSRCLYELAVKCQVEVLEGFVPNGVQLPSLLHTVDILNGDRAQDPHIAFSMDDRGRSVVQSGSTTPAEPVEEEDHDFSGLLDDQRAEKVRRMVKARILNNSHPTSGCRDFEVRLGKIFENWDTGLSRGSLSRHLKRAVKELTDAGHTIYGAAGRYHLIDED